MEYPTMKKLLSLSLLSLFSFAQDIKKDDVLVKITPEISHVETTDSGQKIKIKRVQDVENLLTDDFTKTSRSCPPFCIQPTKIEENIQNIAELEILTFVQSRVSSKKGLLVDTRLETLFELETIPSAINIPYNRISKRLLLTLGMVEREDGTWDGSKAKELAIFDNGVWCEQAKHFLKNILKFNYPKNKISYYRSGLQGWKLLGLTTLVHKEIKVD